MKQTTKRNLIRVIATAILAVGVVVAFWSFIQNNTRRIASQNAEYLNELTTQRAVSIDNMIRENLTFIRSTAYLYGENLEGPEPNLPVLREYESNSAFDMLRFIAKNGDDYTSEGAKANLSDRDYFQAGMRGQTGVTFVKSRVTGERQVGFYSPVYYKNQVIGVMVGFYAEDFTSSLLEYELFGAGGEGWLCMDDGTIIGETVDAEYTNFFSFLEDENKAEEAVRGQLAEAFAADRPMEFSFREKGVLTTAYAVPVDGADWMLIRSFPPAASNQILHNANRVGENLIAQLILMFAAYGIFMMVGVLVAHRRLKEANRDANDVSTGVSRLFAKFITLDLRSGTYHYIDGRPTDQNMAPDGDYEQLRISLINRIPEENQRQEVMQTITSDHLKKSLETSDRVSFRLHVPSEADEWNTYNFIVLERENGQPVRLLMVCQDVTEMYHKEQADKKRLQAALQEAESASRAKTEFLFNMSHDIRTPMNAIMGFTGIAASHPDDKGRVADCLQKIEASSKHLLSLINDVLDMSKIESGKLQLNIEEFSIPETVGSLIDMVRSQAAAKNQELTLDMELAHPRIEGDPLRLNQVLLNILSNAVKYTPADGRIHMRIRELEPASGGKGEGLYEFSVRDNGIGMSKDFLPHIFDHFSRESSSTISRIQGTGLGLSIAKNLVELMQGSISVDSQPGEGTEFVVRIPAPYVEEEKRVEDGPEGEILPDQLAGLRLLLAEDNAINAEIAKVILGEAGFEVDWAENGRIGLDKLRADHDAYRAVLMDIQMPEMDGYEAARAIRAFEAEQGLKPLPVIAMTANTFEDDKRNAFDAGMNAHIAKPYEPEEMIRTVGRYALYGVEASNTPQ